MGVGLVCFEVYTTERGGNVLYVCNLRGGAAEEAEAAAVCGFPCSFAGRKGTESARRLGKLLSV